MAALGEFLHRLTHAMAAESLGDHSDAQLVERALTGHDPVAFQAIVQRHGPMVYRVCWRVLKSPHDCEDAFQATFLILARKLRAVRKPAALASWLHGVAHRVALKVKVQAAARGLHERRAVRVDNPPADAGEWQAALDAELARLPDRWRLPLIHCYLEGQTQDEAAKRLGWSKRTLRRRLDEARAALARRLTARGVVASTAFSGVLISDCLVSAAPTTGLVAATVHATTHAVGISPAVTALMEGVLHAMAVAKIKTATLVVFALGLLGLGGTVGIREVLGEVPTIKKTDGAKQTPPVAKETAAPVPDVAKLIQGTWTATAIREVGRNPEMEASAEAFLKTGKYKIEITGEVLTLLAILDPKAANREMKYRLDLTRTPNGMEILEADKVVSRAIFELDGDHLKICMGDRPAPGQGEPAAPASFDFEKVKAGESLLVLERDADDRPGRLIGAMEGFRKIVPPAQGIGEQNGMSVPEIEPYIFTHLDGVAERLGVRTKAECMVLLSYLKDPDGKIRWIAISALQKLLGAYPGGLSADMLDAGSVNHRKMVLRFVGLIEKLTR